MKKKILALVLSLLICFTAPAALTASALTVSDTAAGTLSPVEKLSLSLKSKLEPYMGGIVFSGSSRNALQELGARLMAGAITDAKTFSFGKAASADEAGGDGFEITAADLSELLKKYVFVKLDDAPEIARMIADGSIMSYHTIEDDKGTLYISVNIEDNPEIFNYAVFRQVVEDLYARQDEALITNQYGKIDYVMSYEHIAGELAMHMLVFAAVNEIMHITRSRDIRLVELYKTCAVADLNIDEARVPSGMIELFGRLVMSTIRFTFYKILGLI